MARSQRSAAKRSDTSSARPAGRMWLLKWLLLIALVVVLLLWLLYPQTGAARRTAADGAAQSSFNSG
ncbi:MAG: hypothetical protein GTO67_03035 [Gammaproteobacteria bacterium]|nr:hypothetical protein [Gammaproteobacteria bacterium]NIT15436.1 hypothetical protein [Gammaproteobacteria bacterium]NIT91514.1 hypothetical protein [Gammaproteobacteria bacterium]